MVFGNGRSLKGSGSASECFCGTYEGLGVRQYDISGGKPQPLIYLCTLRLSHFSPNGCACKAFQMSQPRAGSAKSPTST